MSRGWKLGLGAFGVLLAINVVLAAAERLTGGTPGGPDSSSYATSPGGLGAYAELLARHGRDVRRVRVPAADAELERDSVVVLVDAGFVPRADAIALGRFVGSGGRLLVGGESPWLRHVLASPPVFSPSDPGSGRTFVPVREVAGVRRVATAGEGAWLRTGGALPVYGGPRGTLVAVARYGLGDVVLLADASPLQNRLLAEADNAALGLALAGAPNRVSFLESYHGYGQASGLGAIPASWWTALALLGVATLALMLARGRRLGPPESEERDLPPPRREYVEALAATLARTRPRAAALEPLHERVRALAAERAVPVSSEVAPRGDDDASVLAAGRTLASLERGAGRSAR